MLTLTALRLAQATLGTGASTLYTVPSSTITLVRNIVACNSNASSRTFRLHLVKSGGSPSTTNAITYDQTLTTGATDLQDIFQILVAGDSIRGLASNASSVGVNASGVEITGTFDDITPLMMAQAMLTNSSALLYTVPALTKAVVKHLMVCNVTGSPHTFRLDVVKSGDSISTSSELFHTYSVAANTNYATRLTTCMEAGDMLYAQADANSSLSMHITGIQIA